MRTTLFVTAISLLGACDPPDDDAGLGFIAPLDGQSNVATNADLLVRTGGLDVPEKYALPQNFIQVVNLSDGGFVAGEVVRDGDDILFLPAKAWQPDTRYVWSLSQIPQLPRAPEIRIPEHLTGEAVFDTAPVLEVLDIVLEEVDDLAMPCALFSREITAPNALVTVTIDGVLVDDVHFEVYAEGDWNKGYKGALNKNDPGVSIVCFDVPDIVGGESFRVWWNESGPWQAILEPGQMTKSLKARRRSNR